MKKYGKNIVSFLLVFSMMLTTFAQTGTQIVRAEDVDTVVVTEETTEESYDIDVDSSAEASKTEDKKSDKTTVEETTEATVETVKTEDIEVLLSEVEKKGNVVNVKAVNKNVYDEAVVRLYLWNYSDELMEAENREDISKEKTTDVVVPGLDEKTKKVILPQKNVEDSKVEFTYVETAKGNYLEFTLAKDTGVNVDLPFELKEDVKEDVKFIVEPQVSEDTDDVETVYDVYALTLKVEEAEDDIVAESSVSNVKADDDTVYYTLLNIYPTLSSSMGSATCDGVRMRLEKKNASGEWETLYKYNQIIKYSDDDSYHLRPSGYYAALAPLSGTTSDEFRLVVDSSTAIGSDSYTNTSNNSVSTSYYSWAGIYKEFKLDSTMATSTEDAVNSAALDIFFPMEYRNYGAKFMVVDDETGEQIPGITYTVTNSAGKPFETVEGGKITNITGAVSSNGMTAVSTPRGYSYYTYVALSDVPDQYIVDKTYSLSAYHTSSKYYIQGTYDRTLRLKKRPSDNTVTVKLTDPLKKDEILSGFTLQLQEYDTDTKSYVATDKTFTDNGDGTYTLDEKLSGTSKNESKFRVVDTANDMNYPTGTKTEFTLSDSTKDLTVNLEKIIDDNTGSLIDVIEKTEDKDGNEKYRADITIESANTRYLANRDIYASTKEDAKIKETPVDRTVKADVLFENVHIDEEKVKDNVIYSMTLPDEMIPILSSSQLYTYDKDAITSEWTTLEKYGRVNGYARIVPVIDSLGGTAYQFQIYFTETKGNYDIRFNFRYNANIKDSNGDDKCTNTFDTGDTLEFDLVPVTSNPKTWSVSTSSAGYYVEDQKSLVSDVKISGNPAGLHRWVSVVSAGGGLPFDETYKGVMTIELDPAYYYKIPKTFNDKTFPIQILAHKYGETTPERFAWIYKDGKIQTKNGELEIITSIYPVEHEDYDPLLEKIELKINNLDGYAAIEVFSYFGSYYNEVNSMTLPEITSTNVSSYKPDKFEISDRYTVNTAVKLDDDAEYTQKELSSKASAYNKYSAPVLGNRGVYTATNSYGTGGVWPVNNDSCDKLNFTWDIYNPQTGEHFIQIYEEINDDQVRIENYQKNTGNPPKMASFHAIDFASAQNVRNAFRIFVTTGGSNSMHSEIFKNATATTLGEYMSHNNNWANHKEIENILASNGWSLEDTKDAPVLYVQFQELNVTKEHVLVIAPDMYKRAKELLDANGGDPSTKLVDESGNPIGLSAFVVGLEGQYNPITTFAYQKCMDTHQPSRENGYIFPSTSMTAREGAYAKIEVYQSMINVPQGTRNVTMTDGDSQAVTMKIDLAGAKKNASDVRTELPELYPDSFLYEYSTSDLSGGRYLTEDLKATFDPSEAKYESGKIYASTSSSEIGEEIGTFFLRKDKDVLPSDLLTAMDYWLSDDVKVADFDYPMGYFCSMGEDRLNAPYYNVPWQWVAKIDNNKLYGLGSSTVYLTYFAKNTSSGSISASGELVTFKPSIEGTDGFEKSIAENVFANYYSSASANAPKPPTLTKKMTQSTTNLNTWDVQIDIGEMDYGTYEVYYHDDMRDTKVVDDEGNVICEDASKYIRLNDDFKMDQSYTSGWTVHHYFKAEPNGTPVETAPILATNGKPKGSMNRYKLEEEYATNSRVGWKIYPGTDDYIYYCNSDVRNREFYIDYAPEKGTGEANEIGGAIYDPERPNMYTGFDLYITRETYNVNCKRKITYSVTFDYDEFAKDFGGCGEVHLDIGNTFIRMTGSTSPDSNKVSTTSSSFYYTVGPDITKKISGKDISITNSTYGAYTYSIKASVGEKPQKSVYIVDQISKITESGNELTQDQILELSKYYQLSDINITAKNYLDKAYSENVMVDGEVQDGWKLERGSAEDLKDVDPTDVGQIINGNIFNYLISKDDDTMLPAETYFDITYKLTLDPKHKVDGKTFRQLDFYHGGTFVLSNQAAIAYTVIAGINTGDNDIDNGNDPGTTGIDLAGDDIIEDKPVNAVGADYQWVAAGASVENVKYLQKPQGVKLAISKDKDGLGRERSKWGITSKLYTAGKDDTVTGNFSDTMKVTSNIEDEHTEHVVLQTLVEKYASIEGYDVYGYTDQYEDGKGEKFTLTKTGTDADGSLIFEDNEGRKVVIKEADKSTWGYNPPSEDEKYGHAWMHVFDTEISGFNYNESFHIDYYTIVDKEGLMKELSQYTDLKFDEIEKFEFINSNAITGMAEDTAESSWGYDALYSGSLSKSAAKNDNDELATDWEVNLTVQAMPFNDFDLKDRLTADTSSTDKTVNANNELAVQNSKFKAFEIYNDGDLIYTYDGNYSVGVKTDMPDVQDVWSDATITFTEDKGFDIHFGVLNDGANLKVKYTTALDLKAFIDNGGKLGSQIAFNNAVAGDCDKTNIKGSTSYKFTPTPGGTVAKEKVTGGMLTDAKWKVTANVGTYDSKNFVVTDKLTIPATIADFVVTKDMKVSILDQQGTAKVIYDSANGIDKLAENNFSFDDEFAIGQKMNGFTLTFNEELKDDTWMPANTQVLVEYTSSLDKEKFLEKYPTQTTASYNLTNMAQFDRYGIQKSLTTSNVSNTIGIKESVKKTGVSTGSDSTTKNTLLRWNMDVYLNDIYSIEELEDAQQVVISDVLTDPDKMRFDETAVTVYKLSESGSTSTLAKDQYTIEFSKGRMDVTVKNPAANPNIRVYVTTITPFDAKGVTNKVEVSIFGEKIEEESAPVSVKSERLGNIFSSRLLGSVDLTKTDVDTGDPLENVGFTLYSVADDGSKTPVTCMVKKTLDGETAYLYDPEASSNDQVSEMFTDENGELHIINIEYGEYELTETTGLVGYLMKDADADSRTRKFTVDTKILVLGDDGEYEMTPFVYTMTNESNSIRVNKFYNETVLEKDYTGKVKDAKLQLVTDDNDKTVVATGITDEDGFVDFGFVEPGKYLIVEEQAPNGFYNADDIKITVNDDYTITTDADVDEDGIIQMQDALVRGTLSIVKKGDVISDLGSKTDDDGFLKHLFNWVSGNLQGVAFKIYAAEDIKINDVVVIEKDALIAEKETNSNGVISVDNLPVGSYYAVEVAAKDENYKEDKTPIDLILTYKDAETPEVECSTDFDNERVPYTVSLTKTSSYTDKPLAGAVFGLYAAEDENIFAENDLLAIAITDANGEGEFDVEVPYGNYYVKEIKAPDGFIADDSEETVSFTQDENEVSLTFENDCTELTVLKKDADTTKPLANVGFEIYKVDGTNKTLVTGFTEITVDGNKVYAYDKTANNVSELKTDAQGQLKVIQLPIGNYEVKESSALPGYLTPEETAAERTKTFAFTADDYTEEVSMTNKLGAIYVHKYYDETYGNTVVQGDVEGAKIQIVKDNADKTFVTDATTDDEGNITFAIIEPGKYILQEKEAPKGFLLADDIKFTVKDDYTITTDADVVDDAIQMQDEIVRGEIAVVKKGDKLVDLDSKEDADGYVKHFFNWVSGKLKGVSFDVYAAEDIKVQGVTIYSKDEKIATLETDADGKISLSDMPVGSYYAVEVAALDENYKVDKTPIDLILKYKDAKTPIVDCVVDFENERIPFTVNIEKTNSYDNSPVEGAVFGLYAKEDFLIFNEDDLLDVVTTNGYGKAKFNVEVPYGKYYVQELEAPKGYFLDDTKHDVTFEDETKVTLKLTNDSTKLEVHKLDAETNEYVAGATLQIVDMDGNVVREIVTTSESTIVMGVPAGTYQLVEVAAPNGYDLAEPVEFTVSDDKDDIAQVTMYDKKSPDKPGDDEMEDQPTEDEDAPKTGDEALPMAWLFALILAGTGACVTAQAKRRRRED